MVKRELYLSWLVLSNLHRSKKTSRLINANKNSYFWYELTLWTSTIKRYGSSALQCRVNVLFSMIRSGCSKLEYPE